MLVTRNSSRLMPMNKDRVAYMTPGYFARKSSSFCTSCIHSWSVLAKRASYSGLTIPNLRLIIANTLIKIK